MTSQQSQSFAAATLVLLVIVLRTSEAVTTHTEVVTTPDASVTTPSASSQSVSSRTSKSLLTSVVSQTTDDAPSASSQASKSLLTYLLSLTTVDVTTMSTIMTSRRREYLTTSTAHDVASTRTTTTPVVRTSEEVLGQTSSSARAPISSDVATTDSLSTKRTSTLETHARSSREPPYATTSLLNRTSQTTTPPIVTVTSLPLDAKNVTPSFSDEQLANMTTQMPQTKIIMNESSADYTSEILNTTDSSTSGIIIDVEAKTLSLAIGLGVGIGLAVIILIVVIIVVSLLAKRRQQRRRSDRMKLAPSARNYDRVMLPSQSQPPPGAAKIRRGRRGGSKPQSPEVFALGVQNSPSPNGSVDQTTDLDPPAPKPKPDKSSSKKEDKSNGARRLRGKPPELQKCYFDDGSSGASGGAKAASNDPFWDAGEGQSTPRRPSIADEHSSSLFKPPTSNDSLGSPNSEDASSSPADVQLHCVLLPSGDIGATSTDADTRNLP